MSGGIGTASITVGGITVAALVAVNAMGDVVDPRNGRIVAGARAADGKRLARHDARRFAAASCRPPARRRHRRQPGSATTLGVVATDAVLDQGRGDQDRRRWRTTAWRGRIRPIHTMSDGDIVFALATGASGRQVHTTLLGALAADVLAEAVLRAVRAADGAAPVPACPTCRRRAICQGAGRNDRRHGMNPPRPTHHPTRVAPRRRAPRRPARCRSPAARPAAEPRRPAADRLRPWQRRHRRRSGPTTIWRFESNGWPRERMSRDRPALPDSRATTTTRSSPAAPRPPSSPPISPPRSSGCWPRPARPRSRWSACSRGGYAIRNFVATAAAPAGVARHPRRRSEPRRLGEHGLPAGQRVQRHRPVPDAAQRTAGRRQATRSRPASSG